jgi:hypothetical protein
MYKVLIAYLVVICVFSTPVYANDDFLELFGVDVAEETPTPPENGVPAEAPTEVPDIRVLQADGKEFVAFEPKYAQMLLQMRLDYPKLELKIEKLVTLLNIRGKLVEKALEMNANLEDQLKVKDDVLIGLQEKINNADSFWRSPYLWFAVGIVLATGTTILIFEVAR